MARKKDLLFIMHLLNCIPYVCVMYICYGHTCFYMHRRPLEREHLKLATVASSTEGARGLEDPGKGSLGLDLLQFCFNFVLTMCMYCLFIKITKYMAPCSSTVPLSAALSLASTSPPVPSLQAHSTALCSRHSGQSTDWNQVIQVLSLTGSSLSSSVKWG